MTFDYSHMDLWLYAIITICSLYSFGLFITWWVKIRRVSYMYKLFTFLLLGLFTHNVGSMYVLIVAYGGNVSKAYDALFSWWFSARLAITAAVLVVFVCHITWRFTHMDKTGKVDYGRRYDD